MVKIGPKTLVLTLQLLTASLSLSAQPRVYDLRCESLCNPLGIDSSAPHFSWKVADGSQAAYEIQVASDSLRLDRGKANLWKSGRTMSTDQVMLGYKGLELRPGGLCYWRVRVWDTDGKASQWSPIAHFSIGPDSICGDYIGMDAAYGKPCAPLLRKDFHLKSIDRCLLYVNSLGYHEVYVNGQRVGNNVLVPAVSQLDKHSLILSYDISPYIKKGDNNLIIWLGQGWYKSPTFAAQYPGPLVKAEVDMMHKGKHKHIVGTDSSWIASPGGYEDTGTWQALRFGGEHVDGNVVPRSMAPKDMDARQWHPVKVVTVTGMKATPQMCEPNIICARLTPIAINPAGKDAWLIDMGRVITGWFSLSMRSLQAGQKVRMEYSDWLEPDGTFKSQGESDEYIAAGNGVEVFRNRFNHHAYRFVRVSGLRLCPSAAEVEGLQISGGYTEDASFACSDRDLNAIHDMLKRTLRCLNFSGYMVDCPHLERTGYGGDGNSSTMTAQTMYGLAPAYYNWLQAWGDVISADGSLPYVAPAGGGGGGPWWCAFLVKAPWKTYLNYADQRTMVQLYDKMKLWLKYVERNSPDGLLQPWEDNARRMWFLGDWLAPEGVEVGGESVKLCASCVVSDCLGTMSSIAISLGKDDDARLFSKQKEHINKLIHTTFFHPTDTTYGTGSPLDMAYPQLVGAVPESLQAAVDQKLVSLSVGKYKSHIAVGLMGVPIFTEWITKFRHTSLMENILKQPDYPGYLNMIGHGATTTWEYWNGERSHVHNCYNGIGTWFYQALAGIIPDLPGYKHFTISPQTDCQLRWVEASKETPYGTIAIRWEKNSSGSIRLSMTVPSGTSATLSLPAGTINLDGKTVAIGSQGLELSTGKHLAVN